MTGDILDEEITMLTSLLFKHLHLGIAEAQQKADCLYPLKVILA